MTSQSAISTRKVPVVGILGAIGSGKSFVARSAAVDVEPPWLVLDADRVGHEVLREEAVRTRLVELFTRQILGADGEIDRRQLAALVFGELPTQQAARKQLEQVVHPQIRSRLLRQIEHAAHAGYAAVILDAAILLETGWRTLCDLLVFIDTNEVDRHAQIAGRGWSMEDLARREASQWSLDAKRSVADLVIFNDLKTNAATTALRDAIQSWLKAPPAMSSHAEISDVKAIAQEPGKAASQNGVSSFVKNAASLCDVKWPCDEPRPFSGMGWPLVRSLTNFESAWWCANLSIWHQPLNITSQLVRQPSP